MTTKAEAETDKCARARRDGDNVIAECSRVNPPITVTNKKMVTCADCLTVLAARETEPQKEKKTTILVPLRIPVERVSNLLCSAFEGGSNYWARIEKKTEPTEYLYRSSEDQVYPHIDYPLNPGGSLTISANGDDEHEEIDGRREWVLDVEAIKRGLAFMANNEPSAFGDFLGEDDDQITADVFLQCCLFGKVVYG